MKNKLLLGALILSISANCAFAYITVQETTDARFMKNNGYSDQTVEMINVSKSRASGAEYFTPQEIKEKKENKFVHFWRKWYTYMDPAAEDHSIYHHDSKATPVSSDF